MAMESADMVLMRADIFSVVVAIDLSQAILRCIKRNLFWALAYNVTAIPIAAGLSLPLFDAILPPWVAGGAMALSSVSVVLSSLTLLTYSPPTRKQSEKSQLFVQQSLERGSSHGKPIRTTSTFSVDSPYPTGLERLLSFADGMDMEVGEKYENSSLLYSGKNTPKKASYGAIGR